MNYYYNIKIYAIYKLSIYIYIYSQYVYMFQKYWNIHKLEILKIIQNNIFFCKNFCNDFINVYY